MADEPIEDAVEPEAVLDEPQPRRRVTIGSVAHWTARIAFGLVVLVVLFVGFLHTPPGRQLIVDQIASFAPASGLSVEVGSIEGSVLWSSTLSDVKFRDANDVLFLEVPTIDLNWRPFRWFTSGLDVRHLVLNNGTLHAVPELLPGDPDAPMLPNFDIRIDRFAIRDLTVAEGIIGEERVINFATVADIRDGLVKLDAQGEFGGGDVFKALINAQPDADQFDLDLDWKAPQGGFLAAMVGAKEDLAVRLEGDGTWSSWQGALDVVQGGEQLLEFDIGNDAGKYRIAGRAWPGDYVEGMAANALGEVVTLSAAGTLEDSVLAGDFTLRARGVNADGGGAVDLAGNAFDGFALNAQLLDPELFTRDIALTDARIEAQLDGPFRDLSVQHTLRVREIDASGTIVRGLVQKGTLAYDGTRFSLPLDATIERVVSGIELFDPRLSRGHVGGMLTFAGSELLSDDLAVSFPGLDALLGLNTNFDTGLTRLTGPVDIADLAFDGIGIVDARALIRVALGGGAPAMLDADMQGRVDRVTNSTLGALAGEDIQFAGGLTVGGAQPLIFNAMQITASKLDALLDGRVEEGVTTLTGTGKHVDYGPFTVEATLADDGPRAALVLASPLPAAGLSNVHVLLAPSDDGFTIEANGGSLLGPFDGLVDLRIADNGDTTIGVTRLDVAETRVSGDLQLADGGVSGDLLIHRGGIDGTIALAMRDNGQAFAIDLNASNARFSGVTPISITRGKIAAQGLIAEGNSTITGSATMQGVSFGEFFLGRLAAQAQVENGSGHFDAAMAGRRGSRFEMLLNGDVSPERIALAADGGYAGRKIAMPRRAVLLATDDGGWDLQRTQLSYGEGVVIASGRFGGTEPMQARLAMADMPLDLAGALAGGLGLGGTASGIVELKGGRGGVPTGEAQLMIDGLTRSSSLLTSQPLDIALVASLGTSLAQARAVMSDATGAEGRLQARIANLPSEGGVAERLYAGDLSGQLRFNGSAAALWRLAAIDLIDITGDVQVAANVSGTLGNPQVRGSLAGDALRVRSALTGTDITDVRARGRFTGSRFNLTSFAGDAPNGGRVSGSGFVDLSGMNADRGPQIDIRIAARNAQILDLPTMGATITGPLRIVSNGVGGTIAGRLNARAARWQLGRSEVLASLPTVTISEINLPSDIAPLSAGASPWRYLIDVSASRGIKVDGMGLESEWSGDIKLRGTTADPRIGGEVQIVPRQGFYSFAGVRFDLTRGRIAFDETVAIDPRIDMLAETNVNGISVAVNVDGSASQPGIQFSSTPALPEEELLAQMLFGGSITELSATDALQLGSALASLRGGAGLGPINQLRDAIGVDRLRLIAADPALDRGASVALGKNISRRFYAEIITDGAGYNATELEFRITNWLSLLGTVSTIGRHSVAAEYSRDY